MQAPTVEVRTDQSSQADSTFNLTDPQRDLDILRTLRDAVQAGIHPLFRVPSKLRPLPFAPTDPPAEEVEEPTPLPVVTSPNPVPSSLPAPTLPTEPSPSPPPPPPAEPEPEAVQEVVSAPQDEQDTDSLISYEELEAQQEQETQEEQPQVEPEIEAEIEETDSDSDSDSDLEVAAQLIKPSRSLPSISTTTRPSASQQPTEVVVLSSDSESSGDPDDIIFEDVVEVASADQSPRPAPSQELQRQSYVRRDAPQDGLTLLDNADPTERADPPTSRSRLPDYDTLSRDDRDDTVMTTEDNRCQDPTDEREPERLREGQDGFDSAFGPTKEEEEEKLRQLAVAREREAAAAPTRGISLPANDRRETRGERKDREAREVAERRAKEKAERESTERERETTLSSSSSNMSERAPGSKEEAHAQTVKNAYQIHQHGQPAPPTPNFPPPPHVQARLNGTNPDSRVAPSIVQHHQPNRPYSPPRSRPDIRRRSLSPPRRREYESRFDDRAPPQPFSSQPASFSRPPPPRGRSPVPIRTRTPPTPPSTYSNYPPVRRAPSLTRSIDGGRRQRSRSPPRRPLSSQIDDRRFAPAPPPPALRDDRRPLPPPVDERYRRNGPPPTVYDRERDYPPPPASFQYRVFPLPRDSAFDFVAF